MKQVKILVVTILFLIFAALLNAAEIRVSEPAVIKAAGKINLRGGKIREIPLLNMSKLGAKWISYDADFVYKTDTKGFGYYEVIKKPTVKYTLWKCAAKQTVSFRPNRRYVLSYLINADFPRSSEVNTGFRQLDAGGKDCMGYNVGFPNKTNGWKRWEWEFTTEPNTTSGELQLELWNFSPKYKFQIADISLIELPESSLKPFKKGEGVTFMGGPGNLPMKIVDAGIKEGNMVVTTTGAKYTFDAKNNTITARQMLEKERDVTIWSSSLPLKKLKILKKNNIECVLANDYITFGIQCDSLVMVSPQKELQFNCTSKIGGKWNRLWCGNLLALDEYGGFAANPAIPFGTGRLARCSVDQMPTWSKPGELDFSGKYSDQNFVSNANPGWSVRYMLSPGERLGVSVFPPKPYPWKDSFETSLLLVNREYPAPVKDDIRGKKDIRVLWDFIMRAWAMSWGDKHIIVNDKLTRERIKEFKDLGAYPIFYQSQWFFHSRDPKVFTNQVKKLKKEFGTMGVYYDGLACDDWISAYECMRLTRQIFPDGMIVIHNTFPAPMYNPDIELPAIASYADLVMLAELVNGTGKDWPYEKWMNCNYRRTNSIGIPKNDAWTGLTDIQKDLITLKYNGRNFWRKYSPEYFNVLQQLQMLWEEKGSEPGFYEKYYLPRWEELTKGKIP